jgi:hypothetical protein
MPICSASSNRLLMTAIKPNPIKVQVRFENGWGRLIGSCNHFTSPITDGATKYFL